MMLAMTTKHALARQSVRRPYEIGFLAQKAQPGLAVGSKSQIGLPVVAFGNLQLFVPNCDCCFHFIVTGEREVIDSVEPR
jgi:hypothetical protein